VTPPDADLATLLQSASDLGIDLPTERGAALLRYLRAMLAENEHVNLTAIVEPAKALVLHALDSLAVGALQLEAPRRALDIGTGNGFPGAALAALWPAAQVMLCDRTQKKVAAIRRALDAAELSEHVEAECVDAEQAPALRPDWKTSFNLITARAVSKPEALGPIARPLLAPHGHLALWLDAHANAPTLRGYVAPGLIEYDLPEPAARTRRLAVYRRITS
jgi:16S rRNA (guanine527-N7)-methyltransferase